MDNNKLYLIFIIKKETGTANIPLCQLHSFLYQQPANYPQLGVPHTLQTSLPPEYAMWGVVFPQFVHSHDCSPEAEFFAPAEAFPPAEADAPRPPDIFSSSFWDKIFLSSDII